MNRHLVEVLSLLLLAVSCAFAGGNNYKNFDVAIYSTQRDTQQMKDPAWLESHWAAASRYMKIDRIYLETYRGSMLVDQATLDQAKKFFASKGLKVSGGITTTVAGDGYTSFCYSNPEDRKKLREIVEYTAKNFDDILLDDFFFTNCKSDGEIAAKGNRSWSQYRLAIMDQAGRELIVNAAKKVNPKVTVRIKYPQWYDHFQACGFNLETQPKYFDGIYTGTETRDPVNDSMHIQQYHGYSIFRYLENLNHNNGGGWVDQGGSNASPNRYEEQLWVTLFAKAPEMTLFNFGSVSSDRSMSANGTLEPDSRLGFLAGPVFEKVDKFLGKLGKPIGVKSYKPFHSFGEDYLQSNLGMVGIPMDIVPEFPTEAPTVLLTEQARFDPAIVGKIKKQLTEGKTVVITSGLLKALGKSLDDIVELEYTGRTESTHEFLGGGRGPGVAKSDSEILIPEIRWYTNDSGVVIDAHTSATGMSGTPILHRAKYSKGLLYVLTIPQAMADLYSYPQSVLTSIREVLAKDMYVRLDAPSRVSLFVYDNNTFIVESWQERPVNTARVVTDKRITKLRDLVSGQVLEGMSQGSTTVFAMPLNSGSYRVFAAE